MVELNPGRLRVKNDQADNCLVLTCDGELTHGLLRAFSVNAENEDLQFRISEMADPAKNIGHCLPPAMKALHSYMKGMGLPEGLLPRVFAILDKDPGSMSEAECSTLLDSPDIDDAVNDVLDEMDAEDEDGEGDEPTPSQQPKTTGFHSLLLEVGKAAGEQPAPVDDTITLVASEVSDSTVVGDIEWTSYAEVLKVGSGMHHRLRMGDPGKDPPKVQGALPTRTQVPDFHTGASIPGSGATGFDSSLDLEAGNTARGKDPPSILWARFKELHGVDHPG